MKESINILFTGDFYGGNRIFKLIQDEDFTSIFNDFIPIIKKCDISVTNLEAPLTNESKPLKKTGPAIKSLPKTADSLKFAGFNLVTLANNHILDYGESGLNDTIELLKSKKIGCVGAGMNLDQASSIFYKKVNYKTFAFINVTENEWSTTKGEYPGSNPLNPITNYYAIQNAKKQADFVFVIVHGGHELYSLPSPRMKETYRFFVDSGADVVIGHHTHYISGMEVYNDKLIFYGLGNFIFDKPQLKDPLWNTGVAVQLKISEKVDNYFLIPFSQNNTCAGIKLLQGKEKIKVIEELYRLSSIIVDDNLLKNEFQLMCKRRSRSYKYYLEPHSNRYIYALQHWGILPSFLSRRKKLLYNNLIRCESHKDVVINILENEYCNS